MVNLRHLHVYLLQRLLVLVLVFVVLVQILDLLYLLQQWRLD